MAEPAYAHHPRMLEWIRPPQQARTRQTLGKLARRGGGAGGRKGLRRRRHHRDRVARPDLRWAASIAASATSRGCCTPCTSASARRRARPPTRRSIRSVGPTPPTADIVPEFVDFLVRIYPRARGTAFAPFSARRLRPGGARAHRAIVRLHRRQARLPDRRAGRRDRAIRDPALAARLRLCTSCSARSTLRARARRRSRSATNVSPPSSRRFFSPIWASEPIAQRLYAGRTCNMTAMERLHPEADRRGAARPAGRPLQLGVRLDAHQAHASLRERQARPVERDDAPRLVDRRRPAFRAGARPGDRHLRHADVGEADGEARSSGCATRRSPGSSASSCTASRARCSPPRRSSTRCRGTRASSTAPRR